MQCHCRTTSLDGPRARENGGGVKKAMGNKLQGPSDIYAYFRRNQTPIYFLSPTPFNLLGLDRWVNGFEYLNFFDSFDGQHPKILVPR